MKKNMLIASAAFLIAASANAQTDSTPAQQTNPTTAPAPVSKDKYNNWDSNTYKMQPMPEALNTNKVFPVLGQYELTSKEGAASTVTVTMDETNKGTVWIDGLPEGKIKATLRKSPSTYKIPAQTLGEEKDAKKVAEGVLIYDKDANVLNVCIGCTYNVEDPAVAFAPVEEQTAPEAAPVKKGAKKATSKKAVAKVKPVHYTGAKVIDNTAATPTAPVQQ